MHVVSKAKIPGCPYASPTQNDFVYTEKQEDQTPQVDQHNLVHTGQPKS